MLFRSAKDSGGAELVSIGDYFRLRLDNGGTTARTSYYNGTTWVDLDYPITLAGAGWHHFAATLNAGDALKLYINGNEVATASAPGTINYSGQGTTTRIGSHGNTNTTFDFDGRIDDVRIYDRAMTPEEVFGLYRGSRINGVKILRWVETR